MSFHSFPSSSPAAVNILRTVSRVLIPIAALLTTYLYLYPVFLGCVFPSIDGRFETAFRDTVVQHTNNAYSNPIDSRLHLAPFRLLVLADPQIEGDSSLPDPEDALEAKLSTYWERLALIGLHDPAGLVSAVQEAVTELLKEDIPRSLKAARKRVDLFGNDYYLAHIFRSLRWWTKPTHVTVLGDLIGSQWVDDDEFEWRGWRYWNRVFAGAERVSDEIMEFGRQGSGITTNMDDLAWRNRIINVVGNHDIGYAGDITREKLQRFEEMYGKVNWDLRFDYPASRLKPNATGSKPSLHLVVLNSMLLDTPAMDEDLQTETYEYLNSVIANRVRDVEDRTDFTLLLTHVPLHKKEGTCMDAPFFGFWEEDDCTAGDCKVTGLREQNHLSEFASQSGLTQSIFGMNSDLDSAAQGKGRPGLVLTGHDHEGCDVWHYIPRNSTYRSSEPAQEGGEAQTRWDAAKWKEVDMSMAHTGIREITLRSMMGEFGGNAGLLSLWFDFDKGEWQHDITTCKLGVQHIWWAVHVIDLLAISSLALSAVVTIFQRPQMLRGLQSPSRKSTKLE